MDKKSKFSMLVLLLLALSSFGFQAEAAKSKWKGTLYAVDNTAKSLTIKDKSYALIILTEFNTVTMIATFIEAEDDGDDD